MSDSLRPQELQHARPPCPSPNSWSPPKPMSMESVMSSNHLILCHPLLLLPKSFPASGSFQMSQLFTSCGQSIGASGSASVLPMKSWLISLKIDWFDQVAVQGTLKNLIQPHNLKASILWRSAFGMVQVPASVHDYWKNHSFDYMNLCQQSDVSAFLYAKSVIAFLPRSKCLLIS